MLKRGSKVLKAIVQYETLMFLFCDVKVLSGR